MLELLSSLQITPYFSSIQQDTNAALNNSLASVLYA